MYFVSRPMKIATFLRKNGYSPKRVVDFPRERDTLRNKSSRILTKKVTTTTANPGNRWYPLGPLFLFFLLFFLPFFCLLAFYFFHFLFSFFRRKSFFFSFSCISFKYQSLTVSVDFRRKNVYFVSRPMTIVTFLRKNRETAKQVVDFHRERDTFRNKIMDIVEVFCRKKSQQQR